MQALGLIETKGLVAAIESADAMLKTADVNILEKTYVGGGLVSIAVTGDVAAVKAAVEAGAAAVRNINAALLVSEHVIPRPHENLDNMIISAIPLKDREMSLVVPEKIESKEKVEVIEEDTAKILFKVEEISNENLAMENSVHNELNTEETTDFPKMHLTRLYSKEAVDKIILEYGLDKTIDILSKFTVKVLRKLAREYKNFGIEGSVISRANKKLLITNFREYYEND